MSGVKTTKYSFEQQRKEQMALESTLCTLGRETSAEVIRIKKILNRSSGGLKSTFADEVKRANEWLAIAGETDDSHMLGSREDSRSELKKAIEKRRKQIGRASCRERV